uniref:(northern house mosquito) hypothetical protein n=1 Tax=Culex pipiens TaxID=7175 RepID=A0A8D8BBN9_CULPI
MTRRKSVYTSGTNRRTTANRVIAPSAIPNISCCIWLAMKITSSRRNNPSPGYPRRLTTEDTRAVTAESDLSGPTKRSNTNVFTLESGPTLAKSVASGSGCPAVWRCIGAPTTTRDHLCVRTVRRASKSRPSTTTT